MRIKVYLKKSIVIKTKIHLYNKQKCINRYRDKYSNLLSHKRATTATTSSNFYVHSKYDRECEDGKLQQ